MNGETTRAYGERLADQMAYLDRLVQETSGHQRGIGCYVARHNRRHPDRPVSHNKDVDLSRAAGRQAMEEAQLACRDRSSEIIC